MFKKYLGLSLAIFIMTGSLVLVGCSTKHSTDSDNLTIIGDPNDETFVAVSELFQDEELQDAFTVSADLSFTLMEMQFGQFGNGSPAAESYRPVLAPSADSSIYSVGSYTYENGWHIFDFEATLYVMNDTAATIDGTDSVQISFQGVPIQEPDSTTELDTYLIRAHFVWNDYQQVATFTAHHSVDLHADFDSQNPSITVDASVNQGHSQEFTVYPQTDSMVTCQVDLGFSQTVNDLVYPMDQTGEPGDCPVSGSISMMASIDLMCGSATSGDSLMVDGNWNIDATVVDSGQVRVTFSDGTTTWTTIDQCTAQAQPPAVAIPFRRNER